MKTIKVTIGVVALLWSGLAQAGVQYTNDSDTDQTVTVSERTHYSYYGSDNWDTSNVWSLTLAPGESVAYDDYYSTMSDGGDYSDVFELLAVE